MTSPRILFLELNEASEHFLTKFGDKGVLPNISRIRNEGALIRTVIPDQDEDDERFRRHISPWIIWPTIYTGMLPEEHQLVGFGQETEHLVGRYLWDVLDKAGISCGVFGCLMSHPVRGDLDFYVPEALANDEQCFPVNLEPLQRLFLLAAHNYSENFVKQSFRATWLLFRSLLLGVKLSTAIKVLLQQPLEWLKGVHVVPERAMLHSYLSFDVFSELYGKFRPSFASIQMNHLAYMQHRYWRAAEPDKYKAELSSTDGRLFKTVQERDRVERKYGERIENAFIWTDQMIGSAMSMLKDGDILMIATGLGQHPYDPVHEIHNPVVRLKNPESLFDRIGVVGCQVRHQMNPDLTLDFDTSDDAEAAFSLIDGLFVVEGQSLFTITKRGRQLFLELEVPPELEADPSLSVRHAQINSLDEAASDYIWLSPTNEQSTAHHDEQGLLWIWQKGERLAALTERLPVDRIAPALLNLYGIAPQEWQVKDPPRLFRIE